MTKEMIVSSNGHETMVAILEDDLVAEIFVERERHRGVVGNVYKGRVSKVLPGMQSSFIDLGLERDGFLYVADVIDTLEEFEKLESGEEDAEPDAAAPGGEAGSEGRDRARPQPKIEDLLAFLQQVFDLGLLLLGRTVALFVAVLAAVLDSILVVTGEFLEFEERVEHFRDVEKAVALEPDVDEGGLHAGQHLRHPALVDVADDAAVPLPFHEDFSHKVVFEDRHNRLVAVGGDDHLLVHSRTPWVLGPVSS